MRYIDDINRRDAYIQELLLRIDRLETTLIKTPSTAEVDRLRAELYEATKRAHEHRLAFDWVVVELVPDARADDIEQLWQEAHAATSARAAETPKSDAVS